MLWPVRQTDLDHSARGVHAASRQPGIITLKRAEARSLAQSQMKLCCRTAMTSLLFCNHVGAVHVFQDSRFFDGSAANRCWREFQNRTRKNCRGPVNGAVYGLTAFGTGTQRSPRSSVVSSVAVPGHESVTPFGPRTNWTRVSQTTVIANEQELD